MRAGFIPRLPWNFLLPNNYDVFNYSSNCGPCRSTYVIKQINNALEIALAFNFRQNTDYTQWSIICRFRSCDALQIIIISIKYVRQLTFYSVEHASDVFIYNFVYFGWTSQYGVCIVQWNLLADGAEVQKNNFYSSLFIETPRILL